MAHKSKLCKAADRLSGRCVAITGSNGFIGRRMASILEGVSCEFLVVDGDVTSVELPSGFDVLFHLAAAMPATFCKNPARAFSVNTEGTLRMLEACRLSGGRMVYPSTCGVYCPEGTGALVETSPLAPTNPYAMSKAASELLCAAYRDHYDVPCKILRIFNVYGPGQKPDFLVPYLVSCALNGESPQIRNPNSTRDYVHLDDVVEAMLLAAVMDTPAPVYNVGSGVPVSVRSVVDTIGDCLGRAIPWEHQEESLDPIPEAFADPALAARELAWSPSIPLEKGIRDLIEGMITSPIGRS